MAANKMRIILRIYKKVTKVSENTKPIAYKSTMFLAINLREALWLCLSLTNAALVVRGSAPHYLRTARGRAKTR